MPEEILFVKGGGVSTVNYAKHVAPDNSRISGAVTRDDVLFIGGVDVVTRSSKSE